MFKIWIVMENITCSKLGCKNDFLWRTWHHFVTTFIEICNQTMTKHILRQRAYYDKVHFRFCESLALTITCIIEIPQSSITGTVYLSIILEHTCVNILSLLCSWKMKVDAKIVSQINQVHSIDSSYDIEKACHDYSPRNHFYQTFLYITSNNSSR